MKRKAAEDQEPDIKIEEEGAPPVPLKKANKAPAPPVQQQGEIKSTHVFYPSRFEPRINWFC